MWNLITPTKNKRGGRAIALLFSLCLIIMAIGVWSFFRDFRASKVIISTIFAMVFISMVLVENKWLKLFLLWTIVRTLMGYNMVSYTALVYIFLYITFVQVSINKLERDYLSIILNTICIIALLQVILMILNSYGIWILILPKGTTGNIIPNILEVQLGGWKRVTTGFLSNTNMAGAFLAVCLPAFFRRRWCWFIPLIFVGVYIAHSMGGIIPAWFALIAFGLWKVYNESRVAFFSLIGIVMVSIFYMMFKENSIFYQQTRFRVWGEIWENMASKKPIIGWGVGQFKVVFPIMQRAIMSPYTSYRWLFAHNEPLQLFAEQGAIGLCLILGYLMSLFRKIPKSKIALIAMIALLTGLLNSGVNFLFHTTGGVIFLTWIIILEKEKRWHLQQK